LDYFATFETIFVLLVFMKPKFVDTSQFTTIWCVFYPIYFRTQY